MALRATFEADFSSFQAAVQKAELSLKSFETGANKVGTSINRMADSFSGRKVIQEATVMTSAIEKMGGVSGLTEKEMRRVSATVGEATAKMKAMGMEVPPGMQKLADATKGVGTAASGSTSALSSMAKQLAGMFTVGAVIAFGRELLRMGDDIVRTADRTGLLTDEVQRLNYIAQQSGNSLDELVGAIGQMQNRLASGDKSAVGAVKALNISFAELRAAGPYQQLELIAAAIAKIPDPAGRAQVAMDLFGRAGIAILPTLQSEFKKLGDAAPVMSNDVVKALDRAGDALGHFQLQIKVWAANSYNILGKFFDQFNALVLRTTAGFLDITANIASVFQNLRFPGADKLFPGLAAGLQAVRERADHARLAAQQLTSSTVDMGTQVRKATPLFTALDESMKRTDKTAAKLAKETLKTLSTEIQTTNVQMANFEALVTHAALQSGLREMSGNIDAVAGSLDEFKQRFSKTADLFPEPTAGNLEAWKQGQAVIKETLSVAIVVRDRLKDAFGKIPDILKNAFTGGGGFVGAMKAIGVQMAEALIGPFMSRVQSLASKAAGMLADALLGSGKAASTIGGTALGMGIGGSGAAAAGGVGGAGGAAAAGGISLGAGLATAGIGAAAVGVYVGIKKLMAQRKEMAVNAQRDTFFSKLGNDLETLNPKIQKATGSLVLMQNLFKAKTEKAYEAALGAINEALVIYNEKLRLASEAHQGLVARMSELVTLTPELTAALQGAYSATTPEEYLAAIGEINRVLDEQASKQDFLNSTLEKYGLTWKDLGEEARKAHVSVESANIEKEFRALLTAGVDINNILRHMGGSISDFVLEAKKTGTEIPASFKDVIQHAIDAGEVFTISKDELKKLREEAEKLGKPFDDTKFKVKDLEGAGINFGTTMEEATGKVETAIRELSDVIKNILGPAIKNIPDGSFDVKGHIKLPKEFPKDFDFDFDPVSMAKGGKGMVKKPTLFLAGEAGPEEFAFSGSGKKFGGGGASLSTAQLEAKLDALIRQQARSDKALPYLMVAAWKDAQVH